MARSVVPLRDPRVNFRAMLDYVNGLAVVFRGGKPPPLPHMILYGLGACGKEPTVTELAQAAGFDLKTTSRVLKELLACDWVELVSDKRDTRKKRVRLTRMGDDAMRLVNGALVDCAFRIVENVMGQHPSNPNLQLRTGPQKMKGRKK